MNHPLDNRVRMLWVFIVHVNGEEKILLDPIHHIPLVYLSKGGVQQDGMKKIVQELADKEKVYIELREYKLIDESIEMFYPTAKEYNA